MRKVQLLFPVIMVTVGEARRAELFGVMGLYRTCIDQHSILTHCTYFKCTMVGMIREMFCEIATSNGCSGLRQHTDWRRRRTRQAARTTQAQNTPPLLPPPRSTWKKDQHTEHAKQRLTASSLMQTDQWGGQRGFEKTCKMPTDTGLESMTWHNMSCKTI